MKQLTIAQKGFLLVAVPLAFEIVFILFLTMLVVQADRATEAANRSRLVVVQAQALLNSFFNAASSVVAYGATHDAIFASRFEALQARLPGELHFIEASSVHSEKQKEAIRRIKLLTERGMEILAEAKNNCDRGSFSLPFLSVMEARKEVERLLGQLMSEVSIFIEEEQKVKASSPDEASRSRQMVAQFLAFGVAMNIIVALFLVNFFSKSINARLSVLSENSRRFQSGQELLLPLSGNDEISAVDKNFHEMADALTIAAEKEKEMERIKSELAAVINHDLRSPLTGVNSFLTLLADGVYPDLPEKVLQRAKISVASTNRLISLVNNLLDLEKLDEALLVETPETFYLAIVFDQVMETVQDLVDKKNVSVVISSTTDLKIVCDRARFERLLLNLIIKAIDSSERNDKIDITLETKNSFLEIRIIDAGKNDTAGVAENTLSRVIAEALGGKLEAQRVENKNVVWFTIPVKDHG
ncbi:MAG: HAMP domain-containing histidine kinase [Candidatus Obscuribacterales bacterium]|nr:HAMP domain-containing histidine kinase [Candidatus Obscuribacterales bacterium]